MSKKPSPVGKHMKPVVPKTTQARVLEKAASKKLPSAAKKIMAPKVTFRIATGGYHVYGMTVRPKHFSPEQIAAAVASLD